MEKITLILSKPILAHGQTVEKLEFKEPKGEDVVQNGYPFTMCKTDESTTEAKINTHVVAKYIIDLAGIPRSSVNTLSPSDFMEAVNIVMGFFEGKKENTSSE